ncbi:MAG: division/cell wall cluster transcriptional repressor MraZ [Clostridiales bacterium]|nr:division/cell wall cluster transcriptional repressor MraZ [Clostridiales bacterium]
MDGSTEIRTESAVIAEAEPAAEARAGIAAGNGGAADAGAAAGTGRAAKFYSSYQNSLDAKGRVFVPANYRQGLGTCFTLALAPKRRLTIYPMPEWDALCANFDGVSYDNEEAREFMQLFMGNAVPCEMDKQGRVAIPQDLRRYAGLTKDIVFVGAGRTIEIWEHEDWKAKNDYFVKYPENLTKNMEKYLGRGAGGGAGARAGGAAGAGVGSASAAAAAAFAP